MDGADQGKNIGIYCCSAVPNTDTASFFSVHSETPGQLFSYESHIMTKIKICQRDWRNVCVACLNDPTGSQSYGGQHSAKDLFMAFRAPHSTAETELGTTPIKKIIIFLS